MTGRPGRKAKKLTGMTGAVRKCCVCGQPDFGVNPTLCLAHLEKDAQRKKNNRLRN